MSVLFKDKDASGKPLARVSVDYWVIREDLVTAAIRVLDLRLAVWRVTVEEGLVAGSSELTKRGIERQLKEDLALMGQDWFEGEIGPSLAMPESESVYRVAAEKAVSRLWPGAK